MYARSGGDPVAPLDLPVPAGPRAAGAAGAGARVRGVGAEPPPYGAMAVHHSGRDDPAAAGAAVRGDAIAEVSGRRHAGAAGPDPGGGDGQVPLQAGGRGRLLPPTGGRDAPPRGLCGDLLCGTEYPARRLGRGAGDAVEHERADLGPADV